MFYVIAALLLSVGFALFLATRPRKPQTRTAGSSAATAPAAATRPKTARAKRAAVSRPDRSASRMKPHRRGRHAQETTPQRISREAYLRELAERTRIMQEQQHSSETQNH